MSTKQDHINLIKSKGRFTIDCFTGIFSTEEIEILEKYGHWFRALETGELEPVKDLQKEFVQVTQGEISPVNEYETAWFKYFDRKRWEAKYGHRKMDYHIEDDSFYNREMVKKVRSAMYAVVKENHRT